jgi:hypothetical protein
MKIFLTVSMSYFINPSQYYRIDFKAIKSVNLLKIGVFLNLFYVKIEGYMIQCTHKWYSEYKLVKTWNNNIMNLSQTKKCGKVILNILQSLCFIVGHITFVYSSSISKTLVEDNRGNFYPT